MLDIHNKKGKAAFNHLERNIYKGSCDPPRLSELTVGALFYLAVSKPYFFAICGPGTEGLNLLEQGLLHHCLLAHICCLICNPLLIFETDDGEMTKDLYYRAVFESKDKDH